MAKKRKNMEIQKKADQKKAILGMAACFVIGFCAGAASLYGYGKITSRQQAGEEANEAYDASECVVLGDYKGITVSLAVTEDDIQTEIDSLLEENTAYEQLSGIAQDGDTVYASYDGYINGEKVEDTCGEDYVTIGSGEWLTGFEEAFIGVKTGTKISFEVDVPKGTYGDSSIDGHTIEFRAKLEYICGDAIVPDYNDAFVQSVTSYNSVEEYNAYIEKMLLEENEGEKLTFAWSDVMDASRVLTYPETLMEAAREEVLQGYYDMADLFGVSHDEIFQYFGCEDEQDFIDTELEELAKDTVKESLVSEAIAAAEGLSYTQEEYDTLLSEEYEDYSDMYDSKAKYEKANQYYLERTALVNVVSEWIGKYATFIT